MIIKDSRKRWAVLVMVANSGKILPSQTEYFWTKRGADRYVNRIGDGEFYRMKVVRNG